MAGDVPESEYRAGMIVDALKKAGIDLVVTLPDSWLGALINRIDADHEMQLVRVAREEDGIGICAGAFLGGRKAILLAQNGGMLQSVNALAALAHFHQIPVLMLLASRGDHEDGYFYQVYKDRASVPVLEGLRLPYYRIRDVDDLRVIEGASRQAMMARVPVALLVSRRALLGDT